MGNDLSVFDQYSAPSGEETRLRDSCYRGQEVGATAPGGQGAAPPCDVDTRLPTDHSILKEFILVPGGSGLFTGPLLTSVSATTGNFDAIPTMLLVSLLAAAGLGLVLFLIALVFFGNRIRVRFTFDTHGSRWATVYKRAKAGSPIAILAGIPGGSPQTAGAGGLAASRESELIRWHEVSSVTYNPRHRLIILRSSWRSVGMLSCPSDDCGQLLSYIEARVAPTPAAPPATREPLGKALLRTGLVARAAAPLFSLSSYPFELDLLLPLILVMCALATVLLVPLSGWVVIGCAAILAVQITWTGLSEFACLYSNGQIAFLLAYVGLAYLAWFSWRSLHGHFHPLLFEE